MRKKFIKPEMEVFSFGEEDIRCDLFFESEDFGIDNGSDSDSEIDLDSDSDLDPITSSSSPLL